MVTRAITANQSFRQSDSSSCLFKYKIFIFNNLAEREGFEPSIEFPLYTLSKRAPSTTRPSLLGLLEQDARPEPPGATTV